MARSATTVVLQKQFPRTRKLSCLQTGRHTTSSKCTTHFTCCSMLTEMSVAHTHGHPACSGSFGVYSAMNALRRRMHCTSRDGSNTCPDSDASASSSMVQRCTTWRSLPCLSQPSSGSTAAFFWVRVGEQVPCFRSWSLQMLVRWVQTAPRGSHRQQPEVEICRPLREVQTAICGLAPLKIGTTAGSHDI